MCEECAFKSFCYDRDPLRCYPMWRAVDRDRFYSVYQVYDDGSSALKRNIIKDGFRLFYIVASGVEKKLPFTRYYCIESSIPAARKRFKNKFSWLNIVSYGVCTVQEAKLVLNDPVKYITA